MLLLDAVDSLRSALLRLEELTRLEPNWDGDGNAPPSAEVVGVGGRFLLRAAERFGEAAGEAIRPYVVAPLPGGGVHLEWRGPQADLEVQVGPGEELGYLFVDRRGPERQFEEDDQASPEALLDRLAVVLATRS